MPEETTETTETTEQAPTFTAEYVAELRRESATYRRRAREAEDRAEHAEAERDATRSSLTSDRSTRAVEEAARQVGVADVELAARLVGDQVQLAEDGASNAEELLRGLLEEHPSLRAASTAPNPPSDRRRGPAGEADDQRRQRLYGHRGPDPFASPTEHGGGVSWPGGEAA